MVTAGARPDRRPVNDEPGRDQSLVAAVEVPRFRSARPVPSRPGSTRTVGLAVTGQVATCRYSRGAAGNFRSLSTRQLATADPPSGLVARSRSNPARRS